MKKSNFKTYVSHVFDFITHFRFSLTQLTRCIFRSSLTSMCFDIDINYFQCLTHVWKKLGSVCNLTTLTIYNHSNGLTLSAVKCPAFPSAKRYQSLEKKQHYSNNKLHYNYTTLKIQTFLD